uniref:Uncharacterized protein n=1 Tax=Amphimedon queenslandica TaxID=400682 RepID=A0A1X7VRE2_AMPQE
MKPLSDLCLTCKEISGLIIRSANMQSDEMTTDAKQKALDYRSLVNEEREFYKDILRGTLFTVQVHYKQVKFIFLLPENVAYLGCAVKLFLLKLISESRYHSTLVKAQILS